MENNFIKDCKTSHNGLAIVDDVCTGLRMKFREGCENLKADPRTVVIASAAKDKTLDMCLVNDDSTYAGSVLDVHYAHSEGDPQKVAVVVGRYDSEQNFQKDAAYQGEQIGECYSTPLREDVRIVESQFDASDAAAIRAKLKVRPESSFVFFDKKADEEGVLCYNVDRLTQTRHLLKTLQQTDCAGMFATNAEAKCEALTNSLRREYAKAHPSDPLPKTLWQTTKEYSTALIITGVSTVIGLLGVTAAFGWGVPRTARYEAKDWEKRQVDKKKGEDDNDKMDPPSGGGSPVTGLAPQLSPAPVSSAAERAMLEAGALATAGTALASAWTSAGDFVIENQGDFETAQKVALVMASGALLIVVAATAGTALAAAAVASAPVLGTAAAVAGVIYLVSGEDLEFSGDGSNQPLIL